MDCLAWFTFLFFVFTSFIIINNRHSRSGKPQGPPAWPLVGNIFDLGKNPHQSLYKLRLKYGDLLWLRLGWTNTLVIQTAKAAKELCKNHDASFCDRKGPECWTAQNYTKGSLAFGRYNSTWRFHRRIITLGFMSTKQIRGTVLLRQKCVDDMIRFIEEDAAESGEIQLSNYLFIMAFNVIGNLIFSKDLIDSRSREGNEFFNAMDKVMEFGAKPNLADFFPFFRVLDPQRLKRNMETHLGRTLGIVKKFVMERTGNRKVTKERDAKDFLDILLELNEGSDDGKQPHETISSHNMLIIIMEMFFGGTDTITTTIEWVMTELFRDPESMKKVKEELKKVVGTRRKVNENDIDHLEYLQAVIKETTRLHPIVTLIPRNTLGDTNFMGYSIPNDTQVLINTWAIGRDPDAWDDPLSFKPERFLGSNIQYRGQNYELIPFGSGRRICIGLPFAHLVLHLATASLVQYFDWELDAKLTAEALDTNERFVNVVRKLIPLKAIPKKRMPCTL